MSGEREVSSGVEREKLPAEAHHDESPETGPHDVRSQVRRVASSKIIHFPSLFRKSKLFLLFLSAYCRNFVEEKLGVKYTEGRKTELAKSFSESGPASPVFFILSPGVDPLKDVESLGTVNTNTHSYTPTAFAWTLNTHSLLMQSDVSVLKNGLLENTTFTIYCK